MPVKDDDLVCQVSSFARLSVSDLKPQPDSSDDDAMVHASEGVLTFS